MKKFLKSVKSKVKNVHDSLSGPGRQDSQSDSQRFFSRKILILVVLGFLIGVTALIDYRINTISPNSDISESDNSGEYVNINPEFKVNFSRDSSEVRFEADFSEENPFETENEKGLWDRVKEFFSTRKSSGVTMSLSKSEVKGISDNFSSDVDVASFEREYIPTSSVTLAEVGRDISSEEDASKDTVTNEDVTDGVDIQYQILEGVGLKEEIVINWRDEFDQGCYDKVPEGGEVSDFCAVPVNTFVFDLYLDAGVELRQSRTSANGNPSGTYYFTDKSGNYLAHFLPSFAEDAVGAKTTAVRLDINRADANNYTITVTLGYDWLLDSDRVFPVRIDPSIVHDTEAEFDLGETLNRTESVSGPKVQLVEQEMTADEHTVGLWHMNEDSGSSVSDSSGNGNTGTATGTTVVTGMFDDARSFNGSSDYINVGQGSSLNNLSTMTISAWINISAFSSTYRSGIISRRSGSTGLNFNISGPSEGCGSGHLELMEGGSSYIYSNTVLTTDNWYYVTAVINGTSISLYINGKIDVTGILNWTWDSSTDITIGQISGVSDYYFDGVIDEVRISNVARGAEEIKANYEMRSYGTYISDTLDLGSVSSIDDLQWTENAVATGDGETPYSTTDLVGQWDFNETSGTTADNEGSCGATCDGTLTGMTTTGQDNTVLSGWTYDNRRWGGGAVMFDGSNDYVDMGDSVIDTGDKTISFWMNMVSKGSGYSVIMTNTIGLSSNDAGIDVFYYVSGDYLRFLVGNGTDADYYLDCHGSSLNTGEWYYVTMVQDSNELYSYVNGGLYCSDTSTSGTESVDSSPLRVGTRNYAVDYLFNGIIDSVQVYSRAMDEDEILSNYNSTDIEFMTRTSADGVNWEDWKPTSGETQIEDFDDPCTGGDTINEGIHVFTSGGTLSCSEDTIVHILLVGGGGGGGSSIGGYGGGGGGGGGGLVFYSNHALSSGDYSIGVGNGGAVNSNGGDTTFTGLTTALGGGAGGTANYSDPGSAGGCGGGGGWSGASGGSGSQGGNGAGASGNDGGGGGGGSNGSGTYGGAGTYYGYVFGDGVGDGGYFRGGGGAGVYSGGGSGGSGGGGDGSLFQGGASAGVANTGGGGGGGYNIGAAASGGSGIAIVKVISVSEESNVISVNLDEDIKREGDESISFEMGVPELDGDTVALWHLDETNGDNAGDDIFDETPNDHDGEFNGSNIATSVVDGISGKAREFNGSDDYIDIGNSEDFDVSELTIEAWVYSSDFDQNMFVFEKGHVNTQYAFFFEGTNITFRTDNSADSGDDLDVDSSDAGIVPNQWNYIVATYDGLTKKIYVNGQEKGSKVYTETLKTGQIGARIGAYVSDTPSYFFDGYIDEVRISNVARTAEEIAEAYRMGRGHYISTTVSSTDISSSTKLPFWIAADRPGTYLETTIGENEYSNRVSDSNTVGYWSMEEEAGSGAFVQDSSSYGNDATPTGATYVDGKVGGAWDFDGSGSYLSVPSTSDLNPTSAITIEAWINPDTIESAGAWDRIVEKGANSQYGFSVTQYKSYGLILRIYGTSTITHLSKYIPPTNAWTYVVVTYDGSSVKMYANGILVYSAAESGSISTTSSALVIGDWSSYSRGFDGTIDEVRISNTARTAEEIRQSYEIGLRTHPVTIDFSASLDSGGTGGLISGSGDTSFTIDSSDSGLSQPGSGLYYGDYVIVKENISGTEYIAQGEVSSVTESSGEVSVSSWDGNSTFPSGGFTSNATIFKWQLEYFDTTDILDSHLDGITNITLRVTNGHEGRNVWLDDFRYAGYLSDGDATSNVVSTAQQYLQYKSIFTTRNGLFTPYISDVTVNYTGGSSSPTLDLLMRHGKWFSSGSEQSFWWGP